MLSSSPKVSNYFMFQTAFVLLIAFVGFVVGDFYDLSWLHIGLLFCVLTLTFLGIFAGLATSMITAIVLMVATTSIYLWYAYFVTQVRIPPVSDLIMWLAIFAIAGFVPGGISHWVSVIVSENKFMKERFSELVTVDPDTGFDNKKRLYFEVEEEFLRAQRHHEPFTLLMIRCQFYPEFKSLYGEEEAKHLIVSIANTLKKHTRVSDRKFRVEEDTFALLLIHADEGDAAHVIRHLEPELSEHMLLHKPAVVKLTMAFGHASYSLDFYDHLDLIEHAHGELEHYVQ